MDLYELFTQFKSPFDWPFNKEGMESLNRRENFTRAQSALQELFVSILRNELSNRIPPANIQQTINQLSVNELRKLKLDDAQKRNIRRATWNSSYIEFDITLLHKLLVNVCKIDGILKDDVDLIKNLRNKYGHMHINEETKTNFMETWKEYEEICRRMDARTPNQQYLSTLDQLREREAVIIANSEGEGTRSSVKMLTKTAFLLNIWREENKTFYITKGCKKVIKLMRNISIVTITGDQGSGKSAIAHHIALKYQNEGWNVIPVQDIRNMVGHIDFTISSKQFFVLDDPIGRETISQNCVQDWEKLENTLEMFAGKSSFRVLITCRKQILKELNAGSLLLASVVSLDGDLQLSNKEKEGILKNHVTSNCLKDDEIRAIVLKSSKYFPLLCSIFGGHKEFQKEGVKFFSEPGVIIAKEVHSYKDADKNKWCALFLLVSNQGICDREINWDEKTFNNACSLCGLPSSTQQKTILEQYNIPCGHLLKEEGRLVKFLSEYVMDITTFVFFKEFPSKLIKTCSLQFLCRRVFFVDCTSQGEDSNFSLLLNETTVEFFTDRLLSSLDLNCVEICLCTALRSPMVKHSIKKKLQLMEVNEFEATFLSLVRYNQNIETNEVKSNQSLQEVIQGTMQKLFPNLRPDLPTRKSEEIEVLDIDLDSPVTEIEHDNCALCGITELYERDIQDGEETINVIQGKRKDETFGVKDILINIINNLIPKDSFPEIFSAFIGIIAEFFETPNLIESFGAAWPNFENKLREILINDVAIMKHIELFKAKNVGLFDCCTLKQTILNIWKNGDFDLLQEFLKCLLGRKASVFFTSALDFIIDFSSKLSDDQRCTFWKICGTAYTAFRPVIAHVLAKLGKLDSNNMFLKIPTKDYIESHLEIILHELFKQKSCSWMFSVLPSERFSALAFQHRIQQCDSKHLKMDMAFFCSDISAFECFGLFGHSEIFEAIFSRLYSLKQENLLTVSRKMFLAACAVGDLDIVKRIYALTGKSAKLQRWWFGQNSLDALQISSALHHHKIVSFLLQNKFDVNIVDIFGNTPLLLALQYMKIDITENEKLIVISILKLLIKYNANVCHCNFEGYSPLHIACKFNFSEIVELFLLPGSIEKTSENGNTPLIIAAENGNSNIVNILLLRGANVNCTNSDNCSPLFVSTQKGHIETMRLLLKNGANIDLPNKDKMSPLSIASREGHFYVVELLLQNKANVYQRDNTGNTPALWAAFGGHKHCLQTLMYCGSSLNDWNDKGENLLFLSIARSNLDMTKMLIQEGADIEKSTTYGMRPLHVAVLREEILVTRLLLQNGAIVNSLKGEDLPALHIAARNGNEEMTELLLSYHANINEKDKNGFTAIQTVTSVKNENIISLLSGRSDISLENINGENVLHIAARKGFKSLTGYLINTYLDINSRNKFGETALFLASAYGHGDVVKLLIDNGAEVNFGDENNVSPLYIASQKGYKNIVLTLLRNEARFKMCRMDEVTPLMAASANGHIETAKCLLDYKKNITYINQQDCEGRTALWHAAANGYVEVVKTLLVYHLIDINKPDRYLVRPIMIASAHKHSKVVISLLKNGAIIKSVRVIHVAVNNTVDVFRVRNQDDEI